eukprot:TRINITY_DN936_c0_g3_i3.p1 TRINITY_DN936_c0_g3~~TRINITY_DN936_c0_g3_i3.p1  ORF type:complete len:1790 (+),score=581.46 TRINITY_DN936_c0_g3_i3:390-5372(+)
MGDAARVLLLLLPVAPLARGACSRGSGRLEPSYLAAHFCVAAQCAAVLCVRAGRSRWQWVPAVPLIAEAVAAVALAAARCGAAAGMDAAFAAVVPALCCIFAGGGLHSAALLDRPPPAPHPAPPPPSGPRPSPTARVAAYALAEEGRRHHASAGSLLYLPTSIGNGCPSAGTTPRARCSHSTKPAVTPPTPPTPPSPPCPPEAALTPCIAAAVSINSRPSTAQLRGPSLTISPVAGALYVTPIATSDGTHMPLFSPAALYGSSAPAATEGTSAEPGESAATPPAAPPPPRPPLAPPPPPPPGPCLSDVLLPRGHTYTPAVDSIRLTGRSPLEIALRPLHSMQIQQAERRRDSAPLSRVLPASRRRPQSSPGTPVPAGLGERQDSSQPVAAPLLLDSLQNPQPQRAHPPRDAQDHDGPPSMSRDASLNEVACLDAPVHANTGASGEPIWRCGAGQGMAARLYAAMQEGTSRSGLSEIRQNTGTAASPLGSALDDLSPAPSVGSPPRAQLNPGRSAPRVLLPRPAGIRPDESFASDGSGSLSRAVGSSQGLNSPQQSPTARRKRTPSIQVPRQGAQPVRELLALAPSDNAAALDSPSPRSPGWRGDRRGSLVEELMRSGGRVGASPAAAAEEPRRVVILDDFGGVADDVPLLTSPAPADGQADGIAQLRQLWEFVGGSTGVLDLEGCHEVLAAFGVQMADEDWDEFLEEIDINGDGQVDFEEFARTFNAFRNDQRFAHVASAISVAARVAATQGEMARAKALEVWERHDADRSGTLDAGELAEMCKELGLPHSPHEVSELVKELDEDGDGTIDFAEFMALFKLPGNPEDEAQAEDPILREASKAFAREELSSYSTPTQRRMEAAVERRDRILDVLVHFVFLHALTNFILPLYWVCFEAPASIEWRIAFPVFDSILYAWMYCMMTLPADTKGGVTVHEPAAIRRLYVTSNAFLVDLAVALPLDLVLGIFVEYDGTIMHPVFRLNKTLHVLHLEDLFHLVAKRWVPSPTLRRIGSAFYWWLLISHLFACFFAVVARAEGDKATEIILGTIEKFNNLALFQQYVQAFDWALKTMSGLSRGLFPAEDRQVGLLLATVVSGVAVYALILSTIGSATQMETSESRFRTKVDAVQSFLVHQRLPESFRNEVVQFYRHVFQTMGQVEDQDLMHDLPLHLDLRVTHAMGKRVVAKVPIFASVADDKLLLVALAVRLVPEVHPPGARLTVKGDLGDCMYFITSGECAVLDAGGNPVHVLHQGNFFGEIALLHDVRRTATVVCRRFCNLLTLTREDFNEVTEAFPEALDCIREAAQGRILKLVEQEREERRRRRSERRRLRHHAVEEVEEEAGSEHPEATSPHDTPVPDHLSAGVQSRGVTPAQVSICRSPPPGVEPLVPGGSPLLPPTVTPDESQARPPRPRPAAVEVPGGAEGESPAQDRSRQVSVSFNTSMNFSFSRAGSGRFSLADGGVPDDTTEGDTEAGPDEEEEVDRWLREQQEDQRRRSIGMRPFASASAGSPQHLNASPRRRTLAGAASSELISPCDGALSPQRANRPTRGRSGSMRRRRTNSKASVPSPHPRSGTSPVQVGGGEATPVANESFGERADVDLDFPVVRCTSGDGFALAVPSPSANPVCPAAAPAPQLPALTALPLARQVSDGTPPMGRQGGAGA